MNHMKIRYFAFLIFLCLLLGACGNSTADNASGQSTLTTKEEENSETETTESENVAESPSGEENETENEPPKTPSVPSVTPVENMSELLFERGDIQEVMVVVDRRGFDDITAMANEEEMNAILDELYAADLSEFEDIEDEGFGGVVETYKLRTNDKEINLSVYQDVSETGQQYLRVYGQDRMPLAEIKGPANAFNFNRLAELSTEIRTNTDDPLYSGIASVTETVDEIKLNKMACGYISYFFETALKNEKHDTIDETTSFNVQMKIGDTVYQLQSDTGYFSKDNVDGIVYGQLDEQGLSMVINEAHLRNALSGE